MKLLARLLTVTALVLGGLAGCNSDALPPAAGYASVQGTVVDRATNQAIAGAVVTFDTLLTATTDANGNFKIDQVPSGIADYTVQAKGYTVVTSTSSVEPGTKPIVVDVVLDQAPPGN